MNWRRKKKAVYAENLSESAKRYSVKHLLLRAFVNNLDMAKTEIPAGFYFRDSSHSYFYDGKRMTGVTTILGILAKPALIPWAARMACEYIGARWKGGILFNKIGVAEILAAAQVAHTKKKEAGGEKGTDIHALAEEYIKHCIAENKGKPEEVIANKDKPIGKFIEWAQANDVTFLASEKMFYSKNLFVAGTADMLFLKDGKRYVGDIKTFKKLWDRTPMYQCAGYALLAEEMGEQKFDGYCVLRLSEDGSFEEKWSYDVAGDTRAFLACVELYRQNAQW